MTASTTTEDSPPDDAPNAPSATDPLPRRCALEGCALALPEGSSPRRLYCRDAHKALASLRRKRAVAATVRQALSALYTCVVCPHDGTVFPVAMHARRRGRPRRYDCAECREIARQLRMHERDE